MNILETEAASELRKLGFKSAWGCKDGVFLDSADALLAIKIFKEAIVASQPAGDIPDDDGRGRYGKLGQIRRVEMESVVSSPSTEADEQSNPQSPGDGEEGRERLRGNLLPLAPGIVPDVPGDSDSSDGLVVVIDEDIYDIINRLSPDVVPTLLGMGVREDNFDAPFFKFMFEPGEIVDSIISAAKDSGYTTYRLDSDREGVPVVIVVFSQ